MPGPFQVDDLQWRIRSPQPFKLVLQMTDLTSENSTFEVVCNDEEQYSIWPAEMDTPLGWRKVGKSGSKAECLKYIDEVWKDMRPLSLRQADTQSS